jgi:hypothetical protein
MNTIKNIKQKINGSGWKMATGILATALITGIGFHVTNEPTRDLATKAEVRQIVTDAISSTIRYPWLIERNEVLNHINDRGVGTMHEGDIAKRQRIREELIFLEEKLNLRLSTIESKLKEIKSIVDTVKDNCEVVKK